MHPAGARILREDDQQEMSREAVLLQWERKIEEAERRPRRVERTAGEADDGNESPSGRFERTAEETEEGAEEGGRPRPAARAAAPNPSRRRSHGGRDARGAAALCTERRPAGRGSAAGLGATHDQDHRPARASAPATAFGGRKPARSAGPDRPLSLPAGAVPGGRRRWDRARLRQPPALPPRITVWSVGYAFLA